MGSDFGVQCPLSSCKPVAIWKGVGSDFGVQC